MNNYGYKSWGRTIWVTCEVCNNEYGYSEYADKEDSGLCPSIECRETKSSSMSYTWTNAQLGERERPVVWVDPKDPNPSTRYRYAATYHPDKNPEMPDHFKRRGFEKVEFNSLREHEKFQKETGTVNHKTWDITPSRH